MKPSPSFRIEGHVSPGFEAVREAFVENFSRRNELGGACCVFATDGKELQLRPDTLQLLAAPATPPARGFYDECMGTDGVQFSLGFMKHCPVWACGSESSFGLPGTGGSRGFADPEKEIGMATSPAEWERRSPATRANSRCARRCIRSSSDDPVTLTAKSHPRPPAFGRGEFRSDNREH